MFHPNLREKIYLKNDVFCNCGFPTRINDFGEFWSFPSSQSLRKKNDKIISKTAAIYIISSMLAMDLQLVIVELLSQDIPTTNAFQRNSRHPSVVGPPGILDSSPGCIRHF